VSAPRIAALVVNYNSGEYLPRALHSLWAQRIGGTPAELEVVVVDNASPDREKERPVLEKLREEKGIRLIWNDKNSGYAGGMNLAFRHSTAPLVLAANPDLVFADGCLERLAGALDADPGAAFAGPRGYLDENKTLILPVNQTPSLDDETERFRGRFRAEAARVYSLRCAREMWQLNRAAEAQPIGMLSGACILGRRESLQKHGFFDERYPLFYEDSDLCRRYSNLGFRHLYVPGAHITHFVSRSVARAPRSDDPMRRWAIARERYFREWFGAAGFALVARQDRAIARFARLAGKSAHECNNLGKLASPPELRFAKPAAEALVQVGLDAGFYLCACAQAGGASWRFPAACWPFFATGARVFARALDARDFSLLGAWTFTGTP
jgi:GT2 family glycosyltransferase